MPISLLLDMFKERALPVVLSEDVTEDFERIPFELNNKYYEANIDLCLVHKKDLGVEIFAEAVEAVILHFDNTTVRAGLERQTPI